MIAHQPRYCAFCDAQVAWFCGTNILRCQQERAHRQAKTDPDENAVLWVDLLWGIALALVIIGLVAVVWR